MVEPRDGNRIRAVVVPSPGLDRTFALPAGPGTRLRRRLVAGITRAYRGLRARAARQHGGATRARIDEAAVADAATQWTFTPLWMQKQNGDGTYYLTAKPFSLWYVFHFKVVDG